MKFSVVIPTKDRKQIITKSLARMGKVQNIENIELIVVNDSAEELVLNNFQFDQLQIVKNPGSGVASARNFGASLAKNEWLIFMDDDMWVQPDTFLKLEPLIQDKKESCFNINWIYPDELNSLRSTNPFLRYLNKYGFDSLKGWSNDPKWQPDRFFLVEGITSQFLVIHRDLFKSLGGYNEAFPFAGFEDYDLSERIRKAGVKIFLDPTNLIFHNEEDRMEIENWLERKRRGAVTRKVAVDMGYKNLHLNYSTVKSIINKAVFNRRMQLIAMLNKWPNTQKFDRLFCLILNRLFGAYSYAGYTQK